MATRVSVKKKAKEMRLKRHSSDCVCYVTFNADGRIQRRLLIRGLAIVSGPTALKYRFNEKNCRIMVTRCYNSLIWNKRCSTGRGMDTSRCGTGREICWHAASISFLQCVAYTCFLSECPFGSAFSMTVV